MDALFESRADLKSDFTPSVIEIDQSWLDFAVQPDILDAVDQLIGENIIVWGSAIFCKRGSGGNATPWHQDAPYWPIRPMAACSVWIAVDHSTPENGCLRIIPGSHKERRMYVHEIDRSDQFVLEQTVSATDMPDIEPVDVILEPGMITFFDAYTIHGAEPNISGARRGGVAFRYMPTTSYFDRELSARQRLETGFLAKIAERQLHLVRGVDVCGRNDIYRATD